MKKLFFPLYFIICSIFNHRLISHIYTYNIYRHNYIPLLILWIYGNCEFRNVCLPPLKCSLEYACPFPSGTRVFFVPQLKLQIKAISLLSFSSLCKKEDPAKQLHCKNCNTHQQKTRAVKMQQEGSQKERVRPKNLPSVNWVAGPED